MEKKKEFDFTIPKMKLNRNDDLELREKIMNMTPEERIKLGINKFTLWHIKKNWSEGKTSKIYEKVLSLLFCELVFWRNLLWLGSSQEVYHLHTFVNNFPSHDILMEF